MGQNYKDMFSWWIQIMSYAEKEFLDHHMRRNMRKRTVWYVGQEFSNQHWRPRSLVRIFVVRMKKFEFWTIQNELN